MTLENKNDYVMLFNGIIYKKEELSRWLALKQTNPSTNLELERGEIDYLCDVHRFTLNNPLNMLANNTQRMAGGLFVALFVPVLIAYVVGVAVGISLYLGFYWMLFPALSARSLIMHGQNQPLHYRLSQLHPRVTELPLHLNEDNKRTLVAYRVANIALSIAFFSVLYFTGLTRSWAEDFMQTPLAPPGIIPFDFSRTTYLAASFALGIAGLLPVTLMKIGGKPLERAVNRLVGEGEPAVGEGALLLNHHQLPGGGQIQQGYGTVDGVRGPGR